MQIAQRGLRILVAFTSLLLPFGCSDTDTETEAPKQVRLCGDLDGVEPIEPTIIREDEYGCPVFQPVPCTRPRGEQEWACGPNCRTATAFDSDGDEWVMGCAGGSRPLPVGCIDLEPDPPLRSLCVVDPFERNEWRFEINCAFANVIFVYQSCWAPCDAYTEEALASFCP